MWLSGWVLTMSRKIDTLAVYKCIVYLVGEMGIFLWKMSAKKEVFFYRGENVSDRNCVEN